MQIKDNGMWMHYLVYIKKTYVRVLCLELAVSGVTFYNILFKSCTIARENQCH